MHFHTILEEFRAAKAVKKLLIFVIFVVIVGVLYNHVQNRGLLIGGVIVAIVAHFLLGGVTHLCFFHFAKMAA